MRRIARLLVLPILVLYAASSLADELDLAALGFGGGYDPPRELNQLVSPVQAELAQPEFSLAGHRSRPGATACSSACGSNVCGGFFAAADYMYWRPTNSITPYAGTLVRPDAGSTVGSLPVYLPASLSSQLMETNFGRDNAFRINFGYEFANQWYSGFRYTFFSADGYSSIGDATADSNSVLANRLDRSLANYVLSSSFDDGEVDFASQSLDIDYNTYDLEIGRYLNLNCDRTRLKVFSGLRFADIDQSSWINYQDLEGATTRISDTVETIGMNAWGLRSGFEANRALGRRFSVFTRASASILYAEFTATRSDVQQGFGSAGVRSVSNDIDGFVPVTDLSAGGRFQRGNLCLALGYDVSHWFNMVQGTDAIFQEDIDGNTNGYRNDRGLLSFDGVMAEVSYRY